MSAMMDVDDENVPKGPGRKEAGGNASESNAASSRSAVQPWVEKYRPKTLTSISSQGEVVATLKKAVDSGSMPHLLFYGPPGTGKTSMILALCKDLWGPSVYKARGELMY